MGSVKTKFSSKQYLNIFKDWRLKSKCVFSFLFQFYFIQGQIPCQIAVRYSSIRVFKFKSYHYQASTWARYQSFDNRLEDKPRVGTPICQSLLLWDQLYLTSQGQQTNKPTTTKTPQPTITKNTLPFHE